MVQPKTEHHRYFNILKIKEMKLTKYLFNASVAMACVASAFSMQAENRLYIEDFTLDNYDTPKMVPVMLSLEDPVVSLEIDINLPEGVEVKGDCVINTTTFGNTFMKNITVSDNLIAIKYIQLGLTPIQSGEIEICNIPFVPKAGMLNDDSTQKITFGNVLLTLNATDGADYIAEDVTVTFKKQGSESFVPRASLMTTNAPVVVNPGDKRSVSLSVNNNCDLRGLQFDIIAPENVSISDFTTTSRVPASTISQFNNLADNRYSVTLIGVVENVVTGTSGDFLTFNVAMDEEGANTAELNVDNFYFSYNEVEHQGEGATISVVSGKIALDNATSAIAELNEYLASLQTKIETECPLVAESYSLASAQSAVETLSATVQTAYSDYTLTPCYESIVTSRIAEIRAQADAVVVSAQAAQALEVQRRADNQAAYDVVITSLDALQNQLNEAIAEVQENYSLFEDEAQEAAVQQMIDNARTAASSSFVAVETEGVFAYEAPVNEIQEAIAAIVPDANERRVAYNENLYNEDIERVDALQANYNQTLSNIKTLIPNFTGDANTIQVQEMIDAAREACELELQRVESEGVYLAPAFEESQIMDAIQAMFDSAVATGIDAIYSDAELNDAVIYTLDGRQHSKLVSNQINIVNFKEGNSVKVFVK